MVDLAAPFVWGSGGERLTPEQVERKRKVAELLAKQGGDYSPVQHWTQGAARVAQALAGGWEERKANEAEKANTAEDRGILAGLLGGMAGGTSAVAAPSSPAAGSTADPSVAVAATPAALAPVFTTKEAEYKLPTNYLPQVAKIESGFNANAKNPNSSAEGLFQFVKGTARDYGLTNPRDPIASTDAAARLAADNKATLTRALGREPSAGELYLAHQQGGGGASKLLANPNARAIDVVGRNAVINNGGHEGMTAGEFAKRWTSKVALNEADMPSPDAALAEAPSGQTGFVIPPGVVEGIPGDDPAKLRAEAQAYAQTNPEAARQMLARADAAEAAAAPAMMPPPRPADLAMAQPAAPGMSAQTFNAITSGEPPLDPVFQSEGVAQPWMGTAIPPQPAMVAQAPMPPPRPADLPAPGAVEAIGQMPPQAAPQPQMMPDLSNSPDGGMRQLQVQAEQARQSQPAAPQAPVSPLQKVTAAFTSGGQSQAPAAAQNPAVAAVAKAVAQNPGDPIVQALTSPYASEGTKKVAMALLVKKMESQSKPQWVEQTLPDGSLAQRNSQTGELKIVRQGVDPLDRKGKELDVQKKEREAGEVKPPPTIKVKQADGSEVTLEWDGKAGNYVPLKAPLGGAAVGPAPSNPYALPGKPTEDQSKSAGFANRMAEAHGILEGVEEIGADKTQAGLNNLPFGLNNLAISKERQSYNQAKENFITSVLRKESGAVISDSEFKREEQKYFPLPGDSPEQIVQKRQSRITALKSMMGSAGSGYKLPDGVNFGEKKPKETKQDGPPPPAGVDAKAWKHMTPEERALWK